MQVKFNNLNKQWEEVKFAVEKRLTLVHERSSYILGKDVAIFEENFASFLGVKYAVGVSSGLDALKIGLRALDKNEGDDTVVFIPANTFIATAISTELAYPRAKIVLVDCDEYFQISIDLLENEIEKNLKFKNKIIIPVHLYGCTVDSVGIKRLARKYKCDIVEDASQSHGSQFSDGSFTGTLGKCAAFSLYPGKNLGAVGDAGIVVTNNKKLYEKMRSLRNYGSVEKYIHKDFGYNNRLDTIQAVVLDEKLKRLTSWNHDRNEVAQAYLEKIDNKLVKLPETPSYCGFNSYHVFPVTCGKRRKLQSLLNNNGIQTGIHYPVPIELSPPYKRLKARSKNTRFFSKNILSLPIHPFMGRKETAHVCEVINDFK